MTIQRRHSHDALPLKGFPPFGTIGHAADRDVPPQARRYTTSL